MITFYPNWIFLDKTEDGEYLFKSPSNNRNYRIEKNKDFSILEKIYKEYIGEEYPTVKIVGINPKNDIGEYEYIIKISYTHEELRDLLFKQFKFLKTYKKDKRVTKGLLNDLSYMLDIYGKIYLREE